MKTIIPFKGLLKTAIITSPLLGIMGAAPFFATIRVNYTRTLASFLFTFFMALLLWFLNILLLRLAPANESVVRKWIRYLISAVVGIVLVLLFIQYMRPNGPQIRPLPAEFIPRPKPLMVPPFRMLMPLVQSLSINIIIIVLIELIVLKDKKQKIESENAKLRISNLEATHNRLKQQLQPHFLFNSLNTLKTLISRDPQFAEEYLIRLADLLRMSVYSNQQAFSFLSQELELCTTYLQLQKLRFADALDFTIRIPDEMIRKGKVPSYSLQLLAENAIKHNVLTGSAPLHISIEGHPEDDTIQVINNLQPKITGREKNGIGLTNLSERYRLLGGEPVSVENENGYFTVTINVFADENSDH